MFRVQDVHVCFCRIVVGLPMQSVHITTKAVSSNPAHGDVYSIQRYVIKFVSDLRHVGGFLQVPRFPLPITLTVTVCFFKKKKQIISGENTLLFQCINTAVKYHFVNIECY